MDRMGHDSERAAMSYLHGSAKRRQAIADTLSQLASEELKRGSKRNATRPRGSRSVTEARRGFLTVAGRPGKTGADLQGKLGAPSATRTRDLLLRRQLLYPLSYRGQPGCDSQPTRPAQHRRDLA